MGGLLGLGRVPSPAGVRDGIPGVAGCLPRCGLLSLGESLACAGAGQHSVGCLGTCGWEFLSHCLGHCMQQLAPMTRGYSPATAER